MLCGKTCSIRKILFGTFILVLIGIGGGILLWQFLPQYERDAITTTVEDSASNFQIGDTAPYPPYQFIQCTNTSICCNGLASNCNLPVNKVMYAGIHNGNSAYQDGYRIAPNHRYSLESALDYGYRVINVDMGKCDGVLKLVHGLCALGTRNPYEVFYNINQWLNKNPTEVVMITVQIDNEAGGGTDDVKNVEIYDLLQTIPGFIDKMYSRGPDTEFPVLQELVDSNRRLLFFTYNGEDCYDENVLCPTGFMDWFRYAVETEFSFASIDEVNDKTRSCKIYRGRLTNSLFALNVFVTLPSFAASSQTLNTEQYLQYHIQECYEYNDQRDVNIVFIDFWDTGDLPKVVQLQNQQIALEYAAELEQLQQETEDLNNNTDTDSTSSPASGED